MHCKETTYTTPQNKSYTIEQRAKGRTKLEEFPEQVQAVVMFEYA